MDLANRLRKRQRHLRKWARRADVTCYRLYERDIPAFPLIVDWYDGAVVVWLLSRRKGETAVSPAFRQQIITEICAGLDVTAADIFFKERARQQGLQTQYERVAQQQSVRIVAEQGLRFEVNLSDYLDTGLFLDHRPTRALVRNRAHGQRVLNLFAYTGSFTCYAIAGGARQTTTVDLSRTYCDWAARNLAHNGFTTGKRHRILTADCLQFLQEAAQRRERYDLIVCDPPTFSNSKQMKAASFDVVRDHPALIAACARLLARDGVLLFSTNAQKFELETAVLPSTLHAADITDQTIPPDFRNPRVHQCWLLSPSL